MSEKSPTDIVLLDLLRRVMVLEVEVGRLRHLLRDDGSPARSAPGLLTPADVSGWLEIGEATLAQWRSRGVGPDYFRVGRHVRYERGAVERWLETRSGVA